VAAGLSIGDVYQVDLQSPAISLAKPERDLQERGGDLLPASRGVVVVVL